MENLYGGLSSDALKLYEKLPGMYLILSPALMMIAVSDDYLVYTGKERSAIEGKFIFDVFPNHPDSGIANSLTQALVNRRSHHIPVIRFDTPDPDNPYKNLERYWKTSHHPVLNENGEVDYLIHFTQDVTELVATKKDVTHSENELLAANLNLAQANEEIQSSNEELLAINEELANAQDELRSLNTQLEERVAFRTEQLNKSEKHLAFLLDAMPQQVWTARADGSLTYVNNVICRDFEASAGQIMEHGWQKFIHPDDVKACLDTWNKAVATGKEYLMEFRLKLKGKYVWHLGRAVPLIEDGKTRMWMGTNTDIDLQKQNEHKKDEFISIVSHELKTPLTSIKAFNQLMQRMPETMDRANFFKKSEENILRLEKLIADLLDVTKINAGKLIFTMQDFSFNEMLKDCIESQQLMSPAHQLVLSIDEQIDYHGDRFRIEQVINNFVSNAVKYSPDGGKIMVSAKLELNNIVVSVQDFGIGIAAAELNRLFERYYRVDNSSMKFEGLGLGLFISSEILKRHGGSFWIESEEGKGSTFFFRLPLHQSVEPQAVIKHAGFYKDLSITVAYNAEHARIEADWTGYQTFETVYNGGMMILDMMKKNSCHKVLNDNRHVLGTWSDAADWGRENWFPMMERAGLAYFAWIYAPSVFSQLSAQKSIDISMGKVITQFFTDIELAKDWLDSK